MREADRANTAWLKGVVERHGWIGARRFGKQAAHEAWLLAQHADHDPAWQRQVLALLEAAVRSGDATGSQLAYLTDRVLRSEGRPQRYGTQGTCTSSGWEPALVEDPARLDVRRAEAGLEPIAAYRARTAALCSR